MLFDDGDNFFVCNRGIIVNLEHIRDMNGNEFVLDNGEKISISRSLVKAQKAPLANIFSAGGFALTNVFCPMIELGAIIPGVVLAYLPIKTSQTIKAQAVSCDDFITCVPLYIVRFVCYRYNLKSFVLAIPIVLALSAAYCCSLKHPCGNR